MPTSSSHLKEDHHPTAEYVHDLRFELAKDFPGVTFYFLPADIVSQILNFGLPAPIDIQIIGRNIDANREFANQLLEQLKFVPGIADLRIQQVFNQPKLHFDVDRTKARSSRLQPARHRRQTCSSPSAAASRPLPRSGSIRKPASATTSPTQSPQYDIDTLQELNNIPITNGTQNSAAPQIFWGLASLTRGAESGVVSHYNVSARHRYLRQR